MWQEKEDPPPKVITLSVFRSFSLFKRCPKCPKIQLFWTLPENRCRVSKVNSDFVAFMRQVVVPLANLSESELLGNLTWISFRKDNRDLSNFWVILGFDFGNFWNRDPEEDSYETLYLEGYQKVVIFGSPANDGLLINFGIATGRTRECYNFLRLVTMHKTPGWKFVSCQHA